MNNLNNVRFLNEISRSPEIRRKAESLLGQIFTLFAEAEKLPTRINRNSDTDSSGYDGSSDSDCTATTLSDQMRSPSLKRQDKTSLSRKTKWALYEEKQLKAVTKDVTELVKDLEELFPAPESLRRQLCEKNVPELSIPRTAPLLKDMAVATDDKMMEEVLKKFKRSQQVHNNTANFGPNNLCTRFGQISGTSGGTFNIGT